MGMIRRAFVQGWWLLKQLILSLTPTRRLLLLVAIVFSLMGGVTFSANGQGFSFNLQGVGFGIFILLIMLEVKDKLLARSELEAGRKVQAALIPHENPRFEGWDIWMFTRPANTVGGDLVDFLHLAGKRLGLALGDVAGKGLGAALMMAKLQATLRALVPDLPSLSLLGARMNEIFCRDGMPQRFASLLYLELSPSSGALRLLNAGHLPPIIVRTGGGLENLPRGAPALGILHRGRVRGDLLLARARGNFWWSPPTAWWKRVTKRASSSAMSASTLCCGPPPESRPRSSGGPSSMRSTPLRGKLPGATISR